MHNQHETAEYVQDEFDRTQAGIVMRDAFPGNLKVWGSLRFGLNRARNDSTDNPLYRLRRVIRKGLRSGVQTPEQAMLIAVDLMSVIQSEINAVDFASASLVEQQHDGTEDLHQLMAAMDPAALSQYAQSAKAHLAAAIVAIGAAERALLNQPMQRAAA